MNIFDQLKDIIVYKKNILAEDTDSEKDFTPYMVQRWLSFYSLDFANILNYSSNMLWKSFQEKSEWYNFFLAIIPKSKFKNIKYIKKNKEKNEKTENQVIDYLAESTQLSRREIKEYISNDHININKLKKQLQN